MRPLVGRGLERRTQQTIPFTYTNPLPCMYME